MEEMMGASEVRGYERFMQRLRKARETGLYRNMKDAMKIFRKYLGRYNLSNDNGTER